MKKQIIIAIVAVVILGGVYVFFTRDSKEEDTNAPLTSRNSTGTSATPQVGADVLALLNRINSLKIDTDIFDSLVYQSLEDYEVDIPPQPVGRENPFAPIGGSGPSSGPQAPSGLPRI
jgi:hypothetical protein